METSTCASSLSQVWEFKSIKWCWYNGLVSVIFFYNITKKSCFDKFSFSEFGYVTQFLNFLFSFLSFETGKMINYWSRCAIVFRVLSNKMWAIHKIHIYITCTQGTTMNNRDAQRNVFQTFYSSAFHAQIFLCAPLSSLFHWPDKVALILTNSYLISICNGFWTFFCPWVRLFFVGRFLCSNFCKCIKTQNEKSALS